MTQYSYRKTCFFAIAVLLLFAAPFSSHAQYAKRDNNVLRGTAVLESASEGWRLVPICIYSGRKFYDAGFYQSTPVPMSLIQGTIYDIQKSGDVIGNFTVNDAERRGAAWYGRGSYKNFGAISAAASTADKGSVQLKDTTPDDRPTLKRSKPAAEASAPVAAPSPDEAQMANNDPDRPTLKRGTQAPPPTAAGPREDVQTKQDNERRTREMNVAISDPSLRSSHPFAYNWDDEQKAQLTAAVSKMAVAEFTKVARSRGVTLAPKDNVEFTQVDIRAFDVDYSNNPQLVFSGQFYPNSRQLAGLSEASAKEVMRAGILVVVVARVNYDGQLERIFSEISDPRDLDTYPRMEFVDAVDVDGDDRAELLFANISDAGRRFSVYRLYGLSMPEVFTSGIR